MCPGIRTLDNGKSLYIVHQEDKASALDNSSQPKQKNQMSAFMHSADRHTLPVATVNLGMLYNMQ